MPAFDFRYSRPYGSASRWTNGRADPNATPPETERAQQLQVSGIEIGVIGLIALLSAVALGIDTVLALGVTGLVGLVAVVGAEPSSPGLEAIFEEMAHHFSVSIVLFLFMGQLALRGGLAEDLFQALSGWLPRIHGGIAASTAFAAAVLGPGSGSSAATSAGIARIALPGMISAGYDRRLASASVAMGSLVSSLLPTSSLLVLFAILTGTDVAKLAVSGTVPAMLLAALCCVTTIILLRRRPALAPVVKLPAMRERLMRLGIAGPLLLLALFVMAGLASGLLSPLLAGLVGTGGMLVLAVARQALRPKASASALAAAIARQTAYAIAGALAALVFNRFLAVSGIPELVRASLASFPADGWLVVGLIACLDLLLGAILEPVALLAVMLPPTLPIVTHLGFEPSWYGVFTILLIEIGAILPPIGRNCEAIQSSSGAMVRADDVFNGLSPYLLCALAVVIAVALFPALVQVLPVNLF